MSPMKPDGPPTPGDGPGPPELARRILERALPPGPRSDALVGDLHEEFLARRRQGALRARAWYTRTALAVAWRYLWARSTGDLSRGTTDDRLRHDVKGRGTMDTLTTNLRYSLRRLLKSPFFTLVAIVSLGLGIGVVEEDFQGSLRAIVPEVYVPIMQFEEIQPGSDVYEARHNHSFFSTARLREGATLVEARGVADRLADDLRARFPETWPPDNEFVLVPTADVIMNPMIDRVMLPAAAMMMVVVGLVLLIACANLASFLLARASDRRKEIAVRLAMGAERRTLVGQLLTETVVLSLLGGVAGVGMAVWSLDLLAAAELPLPLPFNVDFSLDGTVLGFSLVVSVLAGLLFGLAPALQST